MYRIALLAVSVVALASGSSAQTVTYYMHQSASPVGVPGGTTTFVIDQSAPVASTPVGTAVSVPKGTTSYFPTFIAPTFAAPATLGLDFDVNVNMSANLAMNNNCAILGAVIERVDSTGVRSFLAQGSLLTTIPQGGAGGTVGFSPRNVSVSVGCDRPRDDVTIQTGESIAVTVSVLNKCKANRTVFLAYDSTSAPSIATFAPTLPPDEVFIRACFAKCQQATSKATAKFVGAKNKCVTKCQVNVRKGLQPSSDCFAPYGGATLACIADPLKGSEAKARASIQKACNLPGRCPKCYDGGDCTTFSLDWVQNIEGAVDSFVPGLYCDPSTAAATGKCMDNTTKVLWKFYASTEKCYDKCFSNEAKGVAAPNSCNPIPTDPPTVACIALAEGRSIAAIDKLCSGIGVVPTCGGSYDYPSGAVWTNLMEIAVDGYVPLTYCTSPSGAFVE